MLFGYENSVGLPIIHSSLLGFFLPKSFDGGAPRVFFTGSNICFTGVSFATFAFGCCWGVRVFVIGLSVLYSRSSATSTTVSLDVSWGASCCSITSAISLDIGSATTSSVGVTSGGPAPKRCKNQLCFLVNKQALLLTTHHIWP